MGRCLCGAVEYAVADTFEYAVNCHCSNCQRETGSAFKPLAGIRRTELRVLRGLDAVATFGEERAPHVRCGLCGSLLFCLVREGAYAHVAMGTLVDAPTIRPSMHVFVGSKAAWYEITDDLPQYLTRPDD